MIASPAIAEPPGDVSPVMMVLGDKYVQIELELTPKQFSHKKLGDFWIKQTGQTSRLASLPNEKRLEKERVDRRSLPRALRDFERRSETAVEGNHLAIART